MRGARAFITLTVALLLVGVLGFILYRMVLVASQYSYSPLSPQIGQTLFAGLAFWELMIVSAITPAITAGAISSEKERQTYEMLLATPLHPAQILWGKLVSALSYVLLLVFVAIPMSSLVFIFGGVSVREMVKALIVLGVVVILYGVIGMFFSALLGRTSRATAISYLVVMLLLFGPMFIAIAVGILNQSDPPRWLLIPSPISALASALSPSVDPQKISNMFWMLGNPTSWIWGTPAISLTVIPRPLYHYSIPLYGAMTIVLYLISTRLVRLFHRWRIQWTEILIALIILLGFIGLVALVFLATASSYEGFFVSVP